MRPAHRNLTLLDSKSLLVHPAAAELLTIIAALKFVAGTLYDTATVAAKDSFQQM